MCVGTGHRVGDVVSVLAQQKESCWLNFLFLVLILRLCQLPHHSAFKGFSCENVTVIYIYSNTWCAFMYFVIFYIYKIIFLFCDSNFAILMMSVDRFV